ncbi:MAG: 2,4-dihydroxyhept-2-ene-1,7-dioic acid aldolase [Bacteroidales bacterium]|nr:2,4-dihydroxyhept-2-ene-1,7-dioic acid aldolase [Bacteroidales bacterium]
MKQGKPFNSPLAGTLLSISAPQVAEIISDSGFDWVLIDMEHSAISLESVQNALQIMGDKILKIVRVPGNDEIWIKRVLDTGCDGILVPMVNSAAEALKVVQYSKYPPEGRRSVGLSRAHSFGPGFSDYVENANKDLVIMIQIEHRDAVKNIDEILKVKGIDSVFIGPYDLSASMGLTGQLSHPDVKSAIKLIKDKCRKAGLPYGIFGMTPQGLIPEVKDGCTFLLCGVDAAILVNSYKDLLTTLKTDV